MTDKSTILFGIDQTENIVAVEPGQDKVCIYIRDESGVRSETRPFSPWLITQKQYDLTDASWTELDGDGCRFTATFPNLASFRTARFKLNNQHADFYVVPSPAKQYLMASGQTLFKGMSYSDVHRLQLDIETLGFTPDDPANEIFLIAISDNRGLEQVLEGDEKSILEEMVRLIRELDPDVIEGHNILGFDFPYILKRAEMLGVKLTLGRDGSEITRGQNRSVALGGISRPMTPFHIFGRNVVDTLFMVQRYDVAKGALSSYGLKEVARALNLSVPDRIVIPHDQIASTWKSSPEHVRRYALQDALETRALSNLIGPAEFYLTQMVPDNYSSVVTGGTGEKINSILIREYLRNKKAIPLPQLPRGVPGGFTQVKMTGLIERVVKCDVESLYPSLMLTDRIKPESDTLDIFLPALEELTKRRFEAKGKAKSATGQDKSYWDGLQGSFKILINSFYGYLGAGSFNFNDYDAAEQITTTGQSLVKQIADELEKTGSSVIEIDTDGVYFQPPEFIFGEHTEQDYIEKIGRTLPAGIRLAHDGRYKAMLSLKVKNYVLVGYDGERIFHGASVRSRADELFGREFISSAVDLLVCGESNKVCELYKTIATDIQDGNMLVEKFARRERITDKTFSSNAKKRLACAAQGMCVGDYVNVYERSDGSIGLVADYNDDEDKKYLLDKLYKFACRLKEAFGDDFDLLFPKPSAKTKAESAGQQTLSLF